MTTSTPTEQTIRIHINDVLGPPTSVKVKTSYKLAVLMDVLYVAGPVNGIYTWNSAVQDKQGLVIIIKRYLC